ncbi:MAG: hypothetical protein ACRDRU_21760 [Pseudonocardiaceae bacterium]
MVDDVAHRLEAFGLARGPDSGGGAGGQEHGRELGVDGGDLLGGSETIRCLIGSVRMGGAVGDLD